MEIGLYSLDWNKIRSLNVSVLIEVMGGKEPWAIYSKREEVLSISDFNDRYLRDSKYEDSQQKRPDGLRWQLAPNPYEGLAQLLIELKRYGLSHYADLGCYASRGKLNSFFALDSNKQPLDKSFQVQEDLRLLFEKNEHLGFNRHAFLEFYRSTTTGRIHCLAGYEMRFVKREVLFPEIDFDFEPKST